MRGQLTLIIIVALLITIMVGIILYAARSTMVKKGEERLGTQQQTTNLLKPIEEYARQCLDLAARTTLEQLGQQAGTIYASQGGTTPDPVLSTDYVSHNGAKVPYAELPPQGNVGTLFFADPPAYPWETFPAVYDNNTLIIAEYLQGYYGINTLPQLSGPNSLQEQLERAVLTKTTDCLHWDIFEPQGITVTPQPATLRVVFGEQTTTFLLHEPIDVTSRVTGTTTHLDTFAIELPVRMKTILDAAHAAIDKDVTDITFDPSSLVYGSLTITASRALFDDIITVTDPSSIISGKQYVFQYARKNRPPALVRTPNATSTICAGGTISGSTASFTADASSCGDGYGSSTIPVRAYDPDEDAVTFTYQIRTEPVMPPATYTVTTSDTAFGILPVTVRASDGQLSDQQYVIIPT